MYPCEYHCAFSPDEGFPLHWAGLVEENLEVAALTWW